MMFVPLLIEAEWRMHVCMRQYTMHAIIGFDNGLGPIWRQAIIWTNDNLLSIGSLGMTFAEIWIKMQQFSYKNAFQCRPQNGGHFVSVLLCDHNFTIHRFLWNPRDYASHATGMSQEFPLCTPNHSFYA